MAQPSPASCPGSRGDALEAGANTGICPVCGERIILGYARLLPEHKSKPTDNVARKPSSGTSGRQ
jgi:hypothetical protein